MQPEVEVVGRGDDGVDELHAGDLHGGIVHREALYDGREPVLSPDLPTDSDSFQSLLMPEMTPSLSTIVLQENCAAFGTVVILNFL